MAAEKKKKEKEERGTIVEQRQNDYNVGKWYTDYEWKKTKRIKEKCVCYFTIEQKYS